MVDQVSNSTKVDHGRLVCISFAKSFAKCVDRDVDRAGARQFRLKMVQKKVQTIVRPNHRFPEAPESGFP